MRINLRSFARIFGVEASLSHSSEIKEAQHRGRTWKTANNSIESALRFLHTSHARKVKHAPIAGRITVRMAQPHISELRKPKS